MSEDRLILPLPDHHADLAAQTAAYRLLVENSIDVIIRYNAKRERIYVSPASIEMLGFTPDEMIDIRASSHIHPDDFAIVDPDFKRVGPALPVLQLTFRTS